MARPGCHEWRGVRAKQSLSRWCSHDRSCLGKVVVACEICREGYCRSHAPRAALRYLRGKNQYEQRLASADRSRKFEEKGRRR